MVIVISNSLSPSLDWLMYFDEKKWGENLGMNVILGM